MRFWISPHLFFESGVNRSLAARPIKIRCGVAFSAQICHFCFDYFKGVSWKFTQIRPFRHINRRVKLLSKLRLALLGAFFWVFEAGLPVFLNFFRFFHKIYLTVGVGSANINLTFTNSNLVHIYDDSHNYAILAGKEVVGGAESFINSLLFGCSCRPECQTQTK